MKSFYPAYLIVFILLVCFVTEPKQPPGFAVKYITGSTFNKLEVLDWGGAGKPVLFLAGNGNTAHVFEGFALKFTDQFHVFGLTRRGFGASEKSKSVYSFDLLTADILAVLDSLHIQKVILIGHSIAGQELSKFASTYPNRVEKIIYLEAAFDYTSTTYKSFFALSPAFPRPGTADCTSVKKLNEYNNRTFGVFIPENEWKQLCVFLKNGSYLKDVTPDSVVISIVKQVEKPNYKNIECPALAIFADEKSVGQIAPFYEGLDLTNRKKWDSFFILFKTFKTEEAIRFAREIPNGKVKKVENANHYLFISNPAETEKLIRDFLGQDVLVMQQN